ncbi:thioredoxin-like protein [Amylocystis lapponica]|nr:thioredoxin-like protein [Amylocystis lapponica]
MASTLAAATKPLLRAQLASRPSNGHVAFIPQIRKLVFEYCDKWPSSANTRTYLHDHLEGLARANPHVEIVVKQRNQKEPIIRGFYLNDRDKVIPLNGFEVSGIEKKVQLLLDASGAKIKPLKRRTVESTTEAARGIWSGLHVDEPFKI